MTAFVVPTGEGFVGPGAVFATDTPAPDSLVVNADSFMISTADTAVFLGSQGAWTVTINGTVLSTAPAAAHKNGISLAINNAAISKFTIGAEGAVGGEDVGMALGSSASVTNKGFIAGDFGITLFGATNTITNSGTIRGDLDAISISASGKTTISNSGNIEGGIRDFTLTNNVTLTNSAAGFIDHIDLGGNNTINKITNLGDITDVTFTAGTNTITNSGDISNFLTLGTGKNTVTNSGSIKDIVATGSGIDIITNSGELEFPVDLLGGDDIFKNTGKFSIRIDLGDGNDQFTGGNAAEIVFDNGGSDKYSLGGGDDEFVAVSNTPAGIDNIDIIDAGAGAQDFYSLGDGTGTNLINIDNVAHNGGPNFSLTIAANKGVGGDTIKNFEHVSGGNGQDAIMGSAAANFLFGDDGIDALFGFGGNDFLGGGIGDDWLQGGVGRDFLQGSSGFDIFAFVDKADSTATARDTIFDFENNVDKIHLFFIDANTKNGSATNDTFSFIGTNEDFTGVAGQLRAVWTVDGHIIQGDTNGDKKADVAIQVTEDPNHLIAWDASDFVL